ncbi:MAG: hypothetical protein R3F14_15750 [Polyangiaceae bacterium]
MASARLLLGEADGADGGLGWNDGGRDALVLDGGGAIAEERLGDGAAFGDRDGGEVDAVGAVADGEDAGHRGARVRVDLDGAALGELHADLFEAEVARVGSATGGEQHRARVDRLAGLGEHNASGRRGARRRR